MLWSASSRGESAVRAAALPLHRPARFVAAASRAGADRVSGGLARLVLAGAAGRPRLLPRRGRRPVASARAHCRRARASSRPKCVSPMSSRRSATRCPPARSTRSSTTSAFPNAWSSLAQGDVPNIAATDGEILISLNREKHGPVRDYEVLLRKRLNREVPGHGVLLRAGEHHQSDSEFRPAGADRPAGGGTRTPRTTTRSRSGCGTASPAFPARPTCTSTRCSSSRS